MAYEVLTGLFQASDHSLDLPHSYFLYRETGLADPGTANLSGLPGSLGVAPGKNRKTFLKSELGKQRLIHSNEE